MDSTQSIEENSAQSSPDQLINRSSQGSQDSPDQLIVRSSQSSSLSDPKDFAGAEENFESFGLNEDLESYDRFENENFRILRSISQLLSVMSLSLLSEVFCVQYLQYEAHNKSHDSYILVARKP